MPRKYVRKIGSRPYKNYTEAQLNEAIELVKGKQLSLRQASQRFNIHRNTIWLKIKAEKNEVNNPNGLKYFKSPGSQPVFTVDEEKRFVAHAIAMSTYGFPITSFDLRSTVKAYLDRCGRKVARFKNNFPGLEWAYAFMKRHSAIISQRTAKNITYSRASTDEKIIDDYFSHLEKEISGVDPKNIWNYDETNLVDDPGNKKVITKRGAKYPEQIRNSSKACTSLMFCGNGAGELAPLYVNYKSEKLWTTWTENGPDGARYNRTKSGWFDHQVFEDWFISLMLPILKKQQGKKVIIGDNLSSHINLEVLRLCEENDIKFIALPPNSTHLLQPLDVAFFRPLKVNWRKILGDWKMSPSGSKCTNIPKDEFPGLLKHLMNAMEPNMKNNMLSGFRKTGIVPLNKEEVTARLPTSTAENHLTSLTDCISNVFLDELKKRREEVTKPSEKKRRKKLNVPAGKSISSADILARHEISNETHSGTRKQRGNNKTKTPKTPKTHKKRKRTSDLGITSEEETDTDENFSLQDSDQSLIWDERLSSENEDDPAAPAENPVSAENSSQTPGTSTHEEPATFSVDNFVVVNFEGKLYPGVVTEVYENGYKVSVMEETKKNWKWPSRPDEILYQKDEVLYGINPPKPVGKRGVFSVPTLFR